MGLQKLALFAFGCRMMDGERRTQSLSLSLSLAGGVTHIGCARSQCSSERKNDGNEELRHVPLPRPSPPAREKPLRMEWKRERKRETDGRTDGRETFGKGTFRRRAHQNLVKTQEDPPLLSVLDGEIVFTLS